MTAPGVHLNGSQAVAEHRYRPAGSAHTLFRCRAPEVLLSGASGTGKSRACLEKMHALAMLNPGMRGLIVRKTAVSLTSTGLVTFKEIVAKEALSSGEIRWYGGSRQQAPAYVYANGSEIVVGGMDKATRIMSSEYDMVYVQEATELAEEDWEALTTRLRNGKVSFQQLMADCNPGPPHHWLKRRCDAGKCEIVYCQHEDNPRLYTAGEWTREGQRYLALLDNLTGVRKLRLRHGRWAAAEGLVYATFDPAVHFHKPIALPPDGSSQTQSPAWRRFLSIDFGYRNPFVCQWWALDPDNRLYLYREIYLTGRLVEDHAREILKYTKRGDGYRPDLMPEAIICDHDAEDRATLERHLECSTVAAIKTVSEGIQAVQARLKVRGDGKPGLYLCRDSLAEPDPGLTEAKLPSSTNEEVLEYIWDPSAQTGGAPKEVPLKKNDHGMDAKRYMVAYLDLQGAPRARWV